MDDINVFNGLSTLSQANQVLQKRLAVLGNRKDLHELKDIFERYGTSSEVGLSLLHKHFTINEGEMVVEFGHVSTPWPVPPSGQVAGGHVVPRSWRFMNGRLVPYEFGFNHPAQSEYKESHLPSGFVEEVAVFLSDTCLDDVLGICAIGNAELEGRIEMNRGRVNFTIPPSKPEDMDVRVVPEHAPSVWAFDCKTGLRDTTMTLARVCWGKEILPALSDMLREYIVPINGIPTKLPMVDVVAVAANRRPDNDLSTFDARNARRLTVAPDPSVIVEKPATRVQTLVEIAIAIDPTHKRAALDAERNKSRATGPTFIALERNELVNGNMMKKTIEDIIALKENINPA
ncbi:hypothetical protein F5Y19DRAFT_474579 [Xylariaceae sp. FL1651]|nr:hypothetical protein F5Y19DRAFT_474579 [Xylariaceae sp. FL1651]